MKDFETQGSHKKQNRGALRALSLIVIGAIGATAISLGVRGLRASNSLATSQTQVQAAAKTEETTEPGENELLRGNAEIADTVENVVGRKALDSIVGITVTVERRQQLMTPFGIAENAPRYVEGVGSGVILTKSGLIITNSHVVNGGDSKDLIVTLSDDTEVEGKVLWADDALDLALVDIDHKDLKPITIADSDALEVGDKVIAIGNPLGLDLQSTLTSGVISGMNRTLTVQGGHTMEELIQTDAAINSGNSGGALLNAAGELIAINTAKASQADGIGFAIPINTAMPIVERVLETGSYEQVALGITGIKADDYEAMYYQSKGKDLELPSGVYVATVADDSAASEAGLQEGDVITAINDTPIDAMNPLKKALIPFKVGDSATLTIVRDGETQTLDLTFKNTLQELESSTLSEADRSQDRNRNRDSDSDSDRPSQDDLEAFLDDLFDAYQNRGGRSNR